jgi:ComF family protein
MAQILNIRLKFKQLLAWPLLARPLFLAQQLLLKSLLAQYCLLCASHEGAELGLCADCLVELPWHNESQCPQCALPSNGLTCGRCLNTPPCFDATLAVFSYHYPVDRLLQHYKYHDMLQLARSFASLLQHKLGTRHSQIDLIIPMPMHQSRLQQRGFNQALEIARIIGHNMQIPLDYQSCQRIKSTPPQAGLAFKERIKNIRGVFHCTADLHGLNLAVVDDVMTSAASLNELAKTLKQAGAARVECWVIARTLAKQPL